MKYRRIPQPKGSWVGNPCYDCCFGDDEGFCTAPKEVLDSEEDCGFTFKGVAYIYEFINE